MFDIYDYQLALTVVDNIIGDYEHLSPQCGRMGSSVRCQLERVRAYLDEVVREEFDKFKKAPYTPKEIKEALDKKIPDWRLNYSNPLTAHLGPAI